MTPESGALSSNPHQHPGISPTRTLFMGAAGRDFQDFNVASTQNIDEHDELPNRRYPPALAGETYPEGIPIRPEADLEILIDDIDSTRSSSPPPPTSLTRTASTRPPGCSPQAPTFG